jgi:hypothetical protein
MFLEDLVKCGTGLVRELRGVSNRAEDFSEQAEDFHVLFAHDFRRPRIREKACTFFEQRKQELLLGGDVAAEAIGKGFVACRRAGRIASRARDERGYLETRQAFVVRAERGGHPRLGWNGSGNSRVFLSGSG